MSSSPLNPGPLNRGALAAAVRSGTPTLGTFIGTASALAAVTRKASHRSRPAAPAPPCRRCRRCPNPSRSGRFRSRSQLTSRYQSMLAGPRRKVWTPMAAPHLLRRRHRGTTIWISPHSCGVRRTSDCYNYGTEKSPGW